jgi:hypothetical protein
MRRRSLGNVMLTLEANCEFDWNGRRFAAYRFGQDASLAPTFELRVARCRQLGRTYFPAVPFASSRYGRVRLIEFTAGVSI